MQRLRSGFTLIEVVVAALILAILASATTPSIIGFLDKQRAQTTADKLAVLASGIAAFEKAVLTGGAGTNTYPGQLKQLTNQIGTVLAVDKNSCGNAFNATAVTNWGTNGPFVNFYIPSTGYVTPIGTVSDALTRNPPTTAAVGTMTMQILNVSAEDAKNLDQIVDGGDLGAAGVVQYGSIATGYTTVTYQIPVAAKC